MSENKQEKIETRGKEGQRKGNADAGRLKRNEKASTEERSLMDGRKKRTVGDGWKEDRKNRVILSGPD